MKTICILAASVTLPLVAVGQTRPDPRLPIIDVHLHATKLNSYIVSQADNRWWPKDVRRPSSDEEVMQRSLAALRRYNIVRAVTSEELPNVEQWKKAAPDRIIPALVCACV